MAYNPLADPSAARLLEAIKGVDGSGSGLDADTLDGHDASWFARTINPIPVVNVDIDTLDNGVVYVDWSNPAFNKLPHGADHPYILVTLLRAQRDYGFRLALQIDQPSDALNLYGQLKSGGTWGKWRYMNSTTLTDSDQPMPGPEIMDDYAGG